MGGELPTEFLEITNNKKVLIITGPTGSGKTALALKLARKYGGELVSADSRQIYRGLNIGTGKDLPQTARFMIYDLRFKNNIEKIIKQKINLGYYEQNKVKIWGLDLIKPNDSFSVAQWVEFAKAIINNIQKRNKLAIIVGGTGYWIRALAEGIEWGKVPLNEKLKIKNYELKINELQKKLRTYPKRFQLNLSDSDWENKRRLVRRMEVADYITKYPNKDVSIVGIGKKMRILYIIKKTDIKELKAKIEQRINARIKQGLIKEISHLLKRGFGFDDPGMNSLGYKEFKEYFIPHQSVQDSTKVQNEVLRKAIEQWKKDEVDYARRQMVYINKYFQYPNKPI